MSEATKTIRDEMLESLTEENCLGAGEFKAVFGFNDPRLEGYVFSVNCSLPVHCMPELLAEVRQNILEASPDGFLQAVDDFLGDREFGTPVMENLDANITIMPLVQGRDLTTTLYTVGYNALTRVMAELPQSAYTQLFDDARFLHEQDYRPDLTSGNIVLDTNRDKLTIIDLDRKMEETASSNKLILGALIKPLVYGFFSNGSISVPPEAVPQVRTAFEKMVAAAEESRLPFFNAKKDMELQTLTEILGYTPEEHETFCVRLDAIASHVAPSFCPKATIECIASLGLDAPALELIATIADIDAHKKGVHAH